MVSVQHSVFITSQETGTVYKLGIDIRIRLASGKNSRGPQNITRRVTRSGHNAPHQMGTLGPVSSGANATVAASVAS